MNGHYLCITASWEARSGGWVSLAYWWVFPSHFYCVDTHHKTDTSYFLRRHLIFLICFNAIPARREDRVCKHSWPMTMASDWCETREVSNTCDHCYHCGEGEEHRSSCSAVPGLGCGLPLYSPELSPGPGRCTERCVIWWCLAIISPGARHRHASHG